MPVSNRYLLLLCPTSSDYVGVNFPTFLFLLHYYYYYFSLFSLVSMDLGGLQSMNE